MLSKTVASYLVLGSAVLVLGQRASPDPYAIVGAGGASSSSQNVPFRRNINDLQSEAGPQWDLYIQALSAMKKAGPADPLSYFQIGGIHGLPAVEWNNTGRRNNNGWGGYCPHNEALFLPWHRPYVLLFEQVLVDHAKRIAAGYRGAAQSQYRRAAESLRTPYWDWAESGEVPASTVPRTININTAQGRRDVENPLASYTFPQEATRGDFGQFSPSPRTAITRCSAPNSYPQTANQRLQSSNLRELVYDAFIYSESFEDFSATSGNGISIEQAHNLVHTSAACGQQFSNLAYAAFDPLFMLHHCNVDRLWALWQAAHPDKSGLSAPYRGNSRYTTPSGTVIRNTSPLAPFYGRNKRPHTPDSVASITQLGYTYEGLDDPPTAENQKREEARRPQRSGDYESQASSAPTQSREDGRYESHSVSHGPRTQTSGAYASPTSQAYESQTSGAYESPTSGAHESQTSGSYESQTSGAYESQTSGAYESQTSGAYESQTSGAYESQTSGAYESQTSELPQPSYEPHPHDRRRKRATALVKKLYAGKSHDKKRSVYLAHIRYKAEELERPTNINVYLCDKYVGNIVALAEPAKGLAYATVPLNAAIEECLRQGVKPEDIRRDGMSVSMTTANGKDIPLKEVQSMGMDIEDLEETPSESSGDFPTIRKRHRNPGTLKQHREKKAEHKGCDRPAPAQATSYVEHEEVHRVDGHGHHHHAHAQSSEYIYRDQGRAAGQRHRGHGRPARVQSAGYGYHEEVDSDGSGDSYGSGGSDGPGRRVHEGERQAGGRAHQTQRRPGGY